MLRAKADDDEIPITTNWSKILGGNGPNGEPNGGPNGGPNRPELQKTTNGEPNGGPNGGPNGDPNGRFPQSWKNGSIHKIIYIRKTKIYEHLYKHLYKYLYKLLYEHRYENLSTPTFLCFALGTVSSLDH